MFRFSKTTAKDFKEFQGGFIRRMASSLDRGDEDIESRFMIVVPHPNVHVDQ